MTSDDGWTDLTSEEKLERRMASFLEPGVPFVSPVAEAEYRARAERIRKAVLLDGTPDRVPVCTRTQYYPGFRAGLTPYEAMYDYGKATDAWLSYNLELQPDTQVAPIFASIPGRAFDILDVRSFHWPGHGTPKDTGFQYNEQEWMKEDEYDLLIDDPTDYLLHVYLPRIASGLQGLAGLASPLDMVEIAASPPWLMRWAAPEVQASIEKLVAAGRESMAWAGALFPLIDRLLAEGFPRPIGSLALAPFDFIGDTLRGTRGILVDMYSQPDRLLEACDRVSRIVVKWITRRATVATPPLVFIPLHKGADGFMSDEQFRTFYWPSLRKVLLGLIEDGFVPYLFAQGGYNSRLEVIRDLPPGRTVWQFDQTDMARAKEALGGVACIQGNVPLSLLQLGTADQVTAYCRDLIDAVAPGGGFILDVGATADTGKEANFRAMIQAAKDYGAY